jgi:predicted metalloendopeptidase
MRLGPAAARFIAALGVCAGLNFIAAYAAPRTDAPLGEPFDVTALDRSANACADFFDYATGTYRKRHPIPAAYSDYGYIEQLVDRTRDIVRDILVRAGRDPGAPGSNTQKIGTFYVTCMDAPAIERQGLAPIRPELARISAIDGRGTLAAAVGHLQTLGVDVGFQFNPTQDYRDSSRTIGEIDQGGMGLPERDYYLRTDPESRNLRAEYAAYIAKLLALSGDPAPRSSARAIVALETSLARASKPAADLREPEATYHPMTIAAIDALAPHVRLRSYLRANAIAPVDRINVAEPVFLRHVDRLLAYASLDTWKRYLRWRLLDTYAPALPAAFEQAEFAFHDHVLNGAKEQLPRWKRCVTAADTLLGEAVGEAYVRQAFPRSAKARALALTLRIKRAYRGEMESLSWMTPATKQTAIAKLAAMGLKVGYPAHWRDYAAYAVRPDSYFANVERGTIFERRYQLAKIGLPVDRNAWFMTPQTVDAYNDTQRNEIVLPAAQLQRPFFDPNGDDAANLGATGAGTIGHEMTHGFDDEGHKFDARGNLRNWWTPRDLTNFDARAHCIIDQFDRTVAVGRLHYQGRLVAGEAIADLGGLVIGYRALETSPVRAKPAGNVEFTPEQRYFLAYAQSWSESVRPEAARTQVLSDPHPLPRDRVNATVANVPGWYAAFNCVKPARPVCEIW